LLSGEALVSVVFGAAMAFIGFTIAAVAEELEPGPFLGFRISYATVSRRVWVRVNRLAGMALGAAGLACIPVGLAWGFAAEAIAFVVAVTAIMVAVTEYSRRLAEREDVAEPPPPGGLERVEGLPPWGSALVASAAAGSTALLLYAAARLYLEGLGAGAWALAVPSIVALYLAYLSTMRFEAYCLPWISSRRGCRLLAITASLGDSILNAAIALLALHYIKTGLVTLALAITLILAAAATVLLDWSRSRRGGCVGKAYLL
jgi:hypothetical protein